MPDLAYEKEPQRFVSLAEGVPLRKEMIRMFGCFSVGSRGNRVLARLAAPLALAVLLNLMTLVSLPHAAHAAPTSGSCPPQYVECDTSYTHTATQANTIGNFTLLDNPVSNNNPNAFIEVTANWNPGGVAPASGSFDNHQLGVWYDIPAGKWGIFNEDRSTMPIGASFNVFVNLNPVIPPPFLVQTVAASNTQGYITFLNMYTLNGNPGASLLVTQNWNPGGGLVGTYNPHAIGVWYDAQVGEWTIYNEDGSPLPIGASFNVTNTQGEFDTITQVATAANTFGGSDSTCFDFPIPPFYEETQVSLLITHSYSGYFTDVSAVWFDVSLNEWCVFDGSQHPMPVGATFFVTLAY